MSTCVYPVSNRWPRNAVFLGEHRDGHCEWFELIDYATTKLFWILRSCFDAFSLFWRSIFAGKNHCSDKRFCDVMPFCEHRDRYFPRNVFRKNGVSKFIGMLGRRMQRTYSVFQTACKTSFANAILSVLKSCSEKKMPRIAATRSIAMMANKKMFRRNSEFKLPSQPVSVNSFSVHHQASIPSFVFLASPRPTSIRSVCLVNLSKESRHQIGGPPLIIRIREMLPMRCCEIHGAIVRYMIGGVK